MMKRSARTELIGRKSLVSLDETKSIWRDHVVKVTLTPADRAVAFADPRELGSNLEPLPTREWNAKSSREFAQNLRGSPPVGMTLAITCRGQNAPSPARPNGLMAAVGCVRRRPTS
jgi:hypothetical protein